MVGIAARAAAGNLGVGVCRAAAGVDGTLHHEDDPAFSQNEAIAVTVERPRRAGGIGVPPRECA